MLLPHMNNIAGRALFLAWTSYSAPSIATNGEDWLVVADVNADHMGVERSYFHTLDFAPKGRVVRR
jgi:hypothetical protein